MLYSVQDCIVFNLFPTGVYEAYWGCLGISLPL